MSDSEESSNLTFEDCEETPQMATAVESEVSTIVEENSAAENDEAAVSQEKVPEMTAEEINEILPGGDLYSDDEDKKEEVNFSTCLNPEIEAMESTIAEVLICPDCKKQFCIDTSDPRDLRCGHSICKDCVNKTFNYEKKEIVCPEEDCKKTHKYEEIDKIPVSYTIKQIITTFTEKKEELSNPKTFNRKLTIHPADEEAEKELQLTGDPGKCENHSLPIEYGCTTCEQWLCGTCVCLDHSGYPKPTCKVYPIRTALAYKKRQALANINNKIQQFETLKVEGEAMDTSITKLLAAMEEESKMLNNIAEKFKKRADAYSKEKEYLHECSNKVTKIINMLGGAKNPTQIKKAIEFYSENKEFIYKKPEENDLFELWKESVYEIDNFWEKNDCFYVKWEGVNPKGWAKVTSCEIYRNTIVTFPDEDPVTEIKSQLIMEKPFFDISSYQYYPFVNVFKSERTFVRLSFMVDENPLGHAFIRRCCDLKYNFKNCKIVYPNKSHKVITFGDKIEKNPKNLVKIGDLEQYKKSFSQGCIGLLSKIENEEYVDINNMAVYVNLMTSAPEEEGLFSFLKKENDQNYFHMCFGEVYDGAETMSTVSTDTKERIRIKASGLFVDAEEDESDED